MICEVSWRKSERNRGIDRGRCLEKPPSFVVHGMQQIETHSERFVSCSPRSVSNSQWLCRSLIVPKRSQMSMKHPFLQGEHNAGRYADQSVVDRYHLRPAYPPETFTILNELIADTPRIVLDIGCGTGNVARPLAEYVERLDAVDLSLPMLERARIRPGGDSPKIRWVQGRAEEVSLEPPYALVTAGESLHWMEWDIVL